MKYKKIVISRTDSIGDVVLTLPLAGWLKREYPDTTIIFLGDAYTREVVEACVHVDEFVSVGEWEKGDTGHGSIAGADLFIHVFPRREIAVMAKKMKVPVRLGTAHRIYHWKTCNKLVAFSRRRSSLHEAQLNFKLLESLTGKPVPSLSELEGLYGLRQIAPLDPGLSALLDGSRFNIILHPKSKGSAREWGLDHFTRLIGLIPKEKFKVFITGTRNEGDMMQEAGFFSGGMEVTDLTGRMSLSQLISFIAAADGLVAASTGPLHLAAALGKHAIGIYPPIRPMHPSRWAPVGRNSCFLVSDNNCDKCRKSGNCECMRLITPQQVLEKLLQNL